MCYFWEIIKLNFEVARMYSIRSSFATSGRFVFFGAYMSYLVPGISVINIRIYIIPPHRHYYHPGGYIFSGEEN